MRGSPFNVTVDEALYSLYAAEFDVFDDIEGNTVNVVPGLCDVDRNGTCDANDIDAMTQVVMDGIDTAEQRTVLIERDMPHGFHTYGGDSNLDGVYEVQVQANDGNGGFDTRTILVTVTNVNEAPTVTLTNLLANLAEDSDTSSPIKIADIVVTDDALGTNNLTLGGADQ